MAKSALKFALKNKKNTMSEMSVGRQKCQLDVRNVSWASEMSVGRHQIRSHQIRRTDQIRSDQTVEKRTTSQKRKSQKVTEYILECGEDITSVSRARKGS